MSMLAALAKTLEPTAVFDRSSLSHQFSEKFPIITLDLSEIASKLIEDYQKLTVNENLERQILEYGDKQQRKTNVKAHMTDWFMQDSSQEFQWVCNRAIDLAAKNNPHQVDMMAYDCWGAIYREGDRTIMHNHWPHLWSFVYYVNCPAGSAPLVFDKEVSKYSVEPKTGLMVMFPGWVNHSVPKHEGKERIMVAGNLSFNPAKRI